VMKSCKEYFSEQSLSMNQSAMAGMPKGETRNAKPPKRCLKNLKNIPHSN